MNGIENSVVKRMYLCNFSYENEIDSEWHSFFTDGLRPQDHVKNVEQILEAMTEAQTVSEQMKNLQSATRIAGRYHKERTELELVLYVLDYKLSKLAQFIYDKLAGYYTPDALEEVDRFFSQIGVNRNHSINRGSKEKCRLRLVK